LPPVAAERRTVDRESVGDIGQTHPRRRLATAPSGVLAGEFGDDLDVFQCGQAAAALFTEIAADEATHLKGFTTALTAVTSPGATVPSPVGSTPTPAPIVVGPARSSGTTLTNLRAAMQGEAFAYAKYMRYADEARRSGNSAVAQLFTNTADVELNEHFAAVAGLAGLVQADTNANLKDAITGEQHEAEVMYPDYARQADQAGNPQAAGLFREIAGDEKTHAQAFEKALTVS
jgi:rubrerythrin